MYNSVSPAVVRGSLFAGTIPAPVFLSIDQALAGSPDDTPELAG
jgi:hypothetical protein